MIRRCSKIIFLLACLSVSFPAAAAEPPLLVKNHQAEAAIVVGPRATEFERWTAGELQRYIQRLSGARLPIVADDELPAKKPLIAVGGPQSNPLAAQAQEKQLVDFNSLKPDGFVIKSIELDGVPTLLVGGRDETGTMYAVYELLERLGVVFQLTGDVIPQKATDVSMPELDLRIEPAIKHRGMQCCHGLRWYMGLDDFRKHIDQLAKLKMNCLVFAWGMGAPWLEFSYKGKVPEIIYSKESGYVAWDYLRYTTSGTAADVLVGRECFPQNYLGPPEFASVRTQKDAYRTAREFLHEVIRYAHSRKVQVWLLVVELPYVPPVLVQPGQAVLHSDYCGKALSPGDPALVDIWTTALGRLIETYPEADAYQMVTSEMYMPPTDEATHDILMEYATARKLIPTVEEIRRSGFTKPASPEQLDSDLVQLGVADKIIRRVKARHPRAKLGVATLFRAYLFSAMDAMLPKDVFIMNMENHGNRKPVMQFYGGIEDREMIAWPRMDADGCELNMQLNAMQYDYDEIIPGGVHHGVAGVIGQLNKERGIECNVRYIAEGAWNPNIDSRTFYKGYLGRLFGVESRDTLVQAYLILEENEKALEWHGRSHLFVGYRHFSPVDELPYLRTVDGLSLRIAAARQDAPKTNQKQLQNEIDKALQMRQKCIDVAARYRVALDLLAHAKPQVLPGSQAELDYVIYKTESFALYLDAVAACYEMVAALDRALLDKIGGDAAQAAKLLRKAQAAAGRADNLAREVARQMIPYADIPTERYLLFRLNQNVIAWTENAVTELVKALASQE